MDRNHKKKKAKRAVPRNQFEAWVLKVADHYMGYRLLILPYLSSIPAPAALSYFGAPAGWLGLILCALLFTFTVYKTEKFIQQIATADSDSSISRQFVEFTATGLLLSFLSLGGVSLLLRMGS